MGSIAFKLVRRHLAEAGIVLNGNGPCDIRVHDKRFYSQVMRDGSLGFGEAYMMNMWSCDDIHGCIKLLAIAEADNKVGNKLKKFFYWLKWKVFNLQDEKRALDVGKKHYDWGNTFFETLLGKSLAYSCGYFKTGTESLDEAQFGKYDLICRKIHLKKGDTVLEIGCGWGGFAYYAATVYGAVVVGVTISKEQAAYAENLCRGLPVTIKLQDYRCVTDQFDHIVSIGMFEHVGPRNYRTYMKVADRCLKPDGMMLLHTIGCDARTNSADPWIEKYIFANSIVPTGIQIKKSHAGIFIQEDLHNFGLSYEKTLLAWYERFKANREAFLESGQHTETSYLMFQLYLLATAAYFGVRRLQLWQFVFRKPGPKEPYIPVR